MKPCSRRQATLGLASGLLLSAQAWTRTRAVSPIRPAPPDPFVEPRGVAKGVDAWIEVDAAAMTHNAEAISRHAGGRPILAVVKTNGYGLGEVAAARAFVQSHAVVGLAVVRPAEAMSLANARLGKPILLMECTTSLEDSCELARSGVHLSLHLPEDVEKVARVADKLGRPIDVHLNIDTGLLRMGMPHDRAVPWAERLSRSRAVRIRGTMTWFAERDDLRAQQKSRFDSFVEQARTRGIELGRVHAASSVDALATPGAWYDMLRVGILLYGGYPNTRLWQSNPLKLQVAHQLKTRVMRIVRAEPGEHIGGRYRLAHAADVATLGVGVNDGFRYSHEDGTHSRVLIRDRTFPIVVRYYNHCMALLPIDSGVRVGDEAVVVGWSHPDVHPNANSDTPYWQAFYDRDLPRVAVRQSTRKDA